MTDQFADTVCLNGKVYTMVTPDACCEAFCIKNGTFAMAGTNEEVKKWIGPDTSVVDLAGRTVFPAFSDSHLHAPGLAYDILFNVNLYQARSREETLDLLERFVRSNPDLDIYYGRGFNSGYFDGVESVKGPRKEHLDRICPDKPVVLSDFGGNYFWMNSKAFDHFHITKETVSPAGGLVELDPDTGELWGILREEARVLVPYQSFTQEQNYQAARWFQQIMNANGYTSILAFRPPGTVEPRTTAFEMFQELERRGELHLRVQGARDMDLNQDIDIQLEEMKRIRASLHSELIQFTTAKFFLDGAIESATGHLLEPYTEAAGKGPDYRASCLWEHELLTYAFQRSMEEGFQIYCHTIGDGAVRCALDALETAFSRMGVTGDGVKQYRNTLTHLQLVSEQDISRMERLSVIAGVQPFWHFKSPTMWWSLEEPLIGRRAEKEYPLASFQKAGVVLVSSSDYPVTPAPNPFHAIQAGVTRNLYDGKSFGLPDIDDADDPHYLLNREERISVGEMILSYTVNAAYARFAEDRAGTIRTGNAADYIVVDQDPYIADPLQLHAIQILTTVFQGNTVYMKDA